MKSPYPSTPDSLCSRVQADVPTSDLLYLRSIHPTRGFFHITIERIIYALASDCRKHGLTHYSPDNEQLVERLLFQRTDPNLAVCQPQGPQPDGATSIRAAPSDLTGQPADVHQAPKRRSGGRGRGRKAKEGSGEQGKS